MALPQAGVELVASGLAAFESGMGRADKTVQDFGQSGAKAGSMFESGFGEVVTGALRQVGALGVDALLKVGASLGSWVKDGVRDAREAAQLLAQTNAVITSTGGAAGVSAKQVTDLATALSAASGKSLFGDAEIQSAENMLLTFTNIKGAVFDAATAISVDMAQALGGAPRDNAIQLGKALQDPIAGITALTRVGVMFTDQQKEQIKAMQEAGNTAGAQQVILAELNKEFGGSAAAAAAADGGWAQFKDTIGEVGETIGAAVLPILTDLANWLNSPAVKDGIAQFAGAVVEAFGWMHKNIPPTIDAVVNGIQELSTWFNQAGGASDTLGGSLDDLNGVWQLALKVIGDVASGYLAVVQAVLPVIQRFIADHGTQISAFFKTTWDSIIQIITLALKVYDSIVPPILQAIAGFIKAHGDEIEKVFSGVWTIVTSIITGALDTIKGVLKLALDLMHGDWDAAWKDIQAIGKAQWDAITGALTGFLNAIAGLFNSSLSDIAQTWKDNWDNLVSIVSRIDWAQVGQDAVDGIINGLANAWDSLLGWVRDKAGDIAQAALDAIGAGSPATEFMPVGEFAVTGIMAGFQSMWPSLMSLVGSLGGDLTDEAQRIADNVQSAMADAFGATASIDRQKISNLKALQDVSEKYRAGVQDQINAVEQEAMQMSDPKQAQQWFALRSKQMIELAKLADQIQATSDRKERALLQAQYDLMNAANNADIKQFQTNTATGGGTSDIVSALEKLLMNDKLPGIIDNPVISRLYGVLDALRNPPASAAQISNQGGTTTNTSTRTYNMPIYTNQSPAVMQDSMAMAQAVMP